MSLRKNIIFIGMTQNGKSSLVQQILRYASEDEMARRVGIGQGNFSETQTCSQYNVDIPLRTHRLRQIDGPEDASWQNDSYVVPGEDFDFDDCDEFRLGHDIQDSGECLQLRLIDTPGLSDSGNTKASNSGMRVIDERHKLRILLTLQEIEDVHAICFVVRRDTNYGGDFQDLVRRMISLLSFSVRSTAWNLQYHIIHTNIDVDDRASDMCQVRQQEFDQFGPAGATHHFVDNTPLADLPLDLYFANDALSGLFKSLVTVSPVKFSNLHYAKSPEHECNDQALVKALQHARAELLTEIEECRKKMASLETDITRYNSNAAFSKKRVDNYETKIKEIDCDTLGDIEGACEEGWTETNFGGGGARLFAFNTTVPIARVDKSHDGDGDWEGENLRRMSYQVTLQPHWFCKSYGKVTLLAKKRDKYRTKIASLNSQMAPLRRWWQENVDKAATANQDTLNLKTQITIMEGNIQALSRDLAVVRKSGHSISLAENQKLVKFFTVDSPLAAAFGYQLVSKVSWTVSPLDKLLKKTFKCRLRKEVTETLARISACKDVYKSLSVQLGIAQGIKVIMAQLTNPPIGAAKLQSAVSFLNIWQCASSRGGSFPGYVRLDGLSELINELESLESDADSWPVITSWPGNEEIMEQILSFSITANAFEQDILRSSDTAFKELQRAIWEQRAAQIAMDYLDQDDGLPVGAFASLIRAEASGAKEPYLTVLSELKDVGELGEMALDE
ncbi:hypothetical protein B0J13DRAFT_628045 [Dactylonectria estremocensis]|uniref:G domain-containing protein n=1 Tax=Dactylonectria estremocensis TaxID=1079267 RepID=A0A9P9DTR8_9HYPO|nr:hypothetical protein B0J13DRAFT_628045 [Dactylonectria estremocensis]